MIQYTVLFYDDGKTNPDVLGTVGDAWSAERVGNAHAKDSDLSVVWWHDGNPTRIAVGETMHEGRDALARYEIHKVVIREVAA